VLSGPLSGPHVHGRPTDVSGRLEREMTSMAVRTLLLRGMLVGLVAGLLAVGFASYFGEPQVDRAIAVEEQTARAAGEPPGMELVSRGMQKTAGLATAVAVYSVGFGGLFALAFAAAYGRIGRVGARGTAALVALGAFTTVTLVPFIKYPANPPSIGSAGTIDRRTELYLGMIVISVLLAVLAVRIGRQLAPRWGSWNAGIVAAGAFVVCVAAVQFALPAVNEVPASFPATVLWRFRLASIGTQAVLWTVCGLLFGALTERSLRPAQRSRSAAGREAA
jgi:hypothetical protein